MKKFILLLIFSLSLVSLDSCADFWMPGIRVYKVETMQHVFTYSNSISVGVALGEVHLHNHATNTIIIIMSNFVDAGGWTLGSNYLEEHLIFSVNTNAYSNLVIAQNEDIQPDFWNIYGVGSKIHIYLPAAVDINSVNVDTDTGSVKLDIDNNVDDLDIKTSTGSIESTSLLNGTTVSMTADTGFIDLENILAESITLGTHSGSIDVNNQLNSTNIRVSTHTGSLNLKTAGVDRMNVTSSTGSLNLDILSFDASSANVRVETGTGSIDVDLGDVQDLNLTATVSTGSIDNSVPFSFLQEEWKTVIGRNGSATRVITLHAETGSISIDQL